MAEDRDRRELTLWDAADHLTTDDAIDFYLEAVLEDGNAALLDAALDDIRRAKAGRARSGSTS